jgi:hypothetical protein
MNRSFLHKTLLLSVIALVIFIIPGCTPNINGTYADSTGLMTVEIKGDKATVKTFAGTFDADCKRDGDKITLTYQGAPLVLTRKADGSLESDNLKLTKK